LIRLNSTSTITNLEKTLITLKESSTSTLTNSKETLISVSINNATANTTNTSPITFTTATSDTSISTSTEYDQPSIEIQKGWTNYYFDDKFLFEDNTYASFYSNFTIDIHKFSWSNSEQYCQSLFRNLSSRGNNNTKYIFYSIIIISFLFQK
jgi:hypothetical protein